MHGRQKMINDIFISVITPSYNRASELEHLMRSISAQSIDHNLFELIISDDGSTDDTEALINSWQEKASFSIKYISQENKGPGAARNHGLEKSIGELILFIDSDCEAHPKWIETIVDEYHKSEFDACGGPDGGKKDFTLLQKAIDYSMTSFFTTGGMRGHSEKMISKFYPRTHNMGVKRDKYEAVGGFGNLRHGQDIEFSHRIRTSGGKIRFIKNALVYHRRRTSLRQFIKQVFNWGVARINLGKIDTAMLEPVHFLPSLSILLSLFIILIIYQLDWGISEIFLLFFSPLSIICLLGALNKKDLRVFPILLLVIPIQIFGYGLGFLQAYIRRFIFNEAELVGFKKNYYK